MINFAPTECFKLRQIDYTPYGETDIGRKRSNNEDSLLLFDPGSKKNLHKVFVVTDGVGGRKNGEIASKTIVQEIFKAAKSGKYLTQDSLHHINKKISQGASTLVLAQQLRGSNKFLIDSAGDSSAILIDTVRKKVMELIQRDEDTWGRVTQVMGPEGSATAAFTRTNRSIIQLEPGQTLLLATDGLTKHFDTRKIKSANLLQLREAYEKDNKKFVKELINMANKAGGGDNITVIAIPYNQNLN
jgi:PPM family protein phosphatase